MTYSTWPMRLRGSFMSSWRTGFIFPFQRGPHLVQSRASCCAAGADPWLEILRITLAEIMPDPKNRLPLAAGTQRSVVVDRCQVCGATDLESLLFLGFLPPVNTMAPIGSRPQEQPA